MKAWAAQAKAENTNVLQVGYFGSYARGDWGVGSDLDVVLILAHSDLPFERRASQFDLTGLPVPVDVLVYTQAEWERLTFQREGKRWWKEVRWG
ncbi:MAG: nucleotidyltransferase domain-containing protein [Anaerolineales bacterium]|nr:nucleotidyltransferase domain-containing protein [Anaerolineales bacterium]